MEAMEMAMAKVPVNIHSKQKSHHLSQHSFQRNQKQDHFDQIGKDPIWGWDANDQQSGE
jgi:hypothetical protein